jgi:aminopeptidase N
MLDASRDLVTPPSVRLADYEPPPFLIDTVDLVVELGEEHTLVKSRLTVRRNPASAKRGTSLTLDGEEQDLVSVALDGAPVGSNSYQRTAETLTLLDAPDEFTLDIETKIEPQNNTQLSGLYKSGGNFCTQCEPEGFRRITYFIDRPDVMARYSTTIVADKARYPVLLSNGNPVDRGESSGGRHWAKWVDPHPKPSYLFALVAGSLVEVEDRFTTRSGNEVRLGIWVRRGDEDKCAHAMASLKKAMAWDEAVFGREYDLDIFNIVAVSDFNMGAMENKGLNIFNTKYVLARPETATDGDYQGIESVVAHEYFHNWTGNRITCRDWFQLSLKEGLTVFRDQEFSADQGSRAVRRIGDVRGLRAAQFPEDAGPLAHPVQPDHYIQIDNFYTATVYNKGAEVIRMQQALLGKEGFRRGMDLYFERHDNQAVTIEDFVAAMADANGADLSQIRNWYVQAGTPELTISDKYDAATRSWTLTVAQKTPPTPGQPVKKPMLIPLAMGLLGPDGTEQPTQLEGDAAPVAGTRVLQVREASQSFRFIDVAAPPVPSLLRGFSAPVKISGVSFDRLKFLAVNDREPFSRWEAGQQVATHALLDMIEGYRRGVDLALDRDIIEALRRTLDHSDSDPAFAAEMLILPSETFLADQQDTVDVEAIHAVRHFARVEIGHALADQFAATYEALTDTGVYAIDGPSIGRRALRNVCLGYLAVAGSASGVARAKAQFDAGRNMTDVLAALSVLVDLDVPERDAALQAFYARWQQDELVTDKWFSLQATSSRPDTLDKVKALTAHPAFTIKNPNRARALIAAFGYSNQLRFHEASGAGYVFLADQVIALDPLNATLASRFIKPLGAWSRYDTRRQTLMKRELQRVLALPGISKNTFEMASKSLGDGHA